MPKHKFKRSWRRERESKGKQLDLQVVGLDEAKLIIVQVQIFFLNSHSFRHFTLHKNSNCPSNEQVNCVNTFSAPYIKQHAIIHMLYRADQAKYLSR